MASQVPRRQRLWRRKQLLVLLALPVLLLTGLFGSQARVHAASYCQVSYSVVSQWPGGFSVNLVLQNTGSSTWNGWTLTFTFPASGQAVTQGWNGNFSQSGQNVTVTNASWNGTVAVNSSVSLGFNGSWTTSNPTPTTFAVNGNTCGGSSGGGTPTPTPSPSPTPGSTPTATPTPRPTVTPTPTPGTTPTPTPTAAPTSTPTPGVHVDNPYAGAQGFINPYWAAEVRAGAASVGGTLGQKEAQVANYSTAVWLDSIGAVTGGTGYPTNLSGYLDAAEQQAASSSQPIVITFVVYDLPNRDCAALASNGELSVSNNGLATYKSQFIDPIAATFSQSKYSNLRIVAIIEPDSLPNLVTNLSIAKCAEANSSGAYVQGIQYAINKLHAIPNVYLYVDIAHSGWLGWSSNFQPAVTLISNTIKGTTAGVNSIDGFISNTANYTPTTEPYMTANETIGGQPVRSANFYQWNNYIDELPYDIDMRNAFIAQGFPSTIGMLIDTSRNGWGGPNRPTGPSTATDLNTFVDQTRIDRRYSRGNWCNQPGGIGARPQANPSSGFDAFVWIKPPGESDGSSSLIPQGPNNPTGKGFDRMCDPTYGGNSMNNNQPTGAMPNAPVSGAWFQAGFDTLVQNAYPPF
ncbi:glycoside hydrolase family 6 protein [Thermogemmatispora carboxidivorans]|uniref:glycoside hydrolase family 6 protein n=1 Tax=Thermogemmatispora carboxidivorans TaxID=1382306 RepID=UPI0009DEA3C9|nr:glycoside hydrolase family 6 protein [Thermogemmatispora carboxidivorans]